MNIETKFEIGQYVWLLYDNKAIKQEVNSIYVTIERKCGEIKPVILYDITFCAGGFKEDALFETKDALLQSL